MKELFPLVSVFCPTYNHEKYISQCLEGIAMQQINFSIEVIVQDDASTDCTAELIKKYASKYNYIIPILHKENQYSKGKNLNEYFFKNAKGKYFAFCEGDDYWTDPYKLQKQIDFLEANPEFSICFTNATILDERKNNISANETGQNLILDYWDSKIISQDELFSYNCILTLTTVFRVNFRELPEWFIEVKYGDWVLHILNSMYGKIYYFQEPTAVYRKHDTGFFSSLDNIRRIQNYLDSGEIIRNNMETRFATKMLKGQRDRLKELLISNLQNESVRNNILLLWNYKKIITLKFVLKETFREIKYFSSKLKLLLQ